MLLLLALVLGLTVTTAPSVNAILPEIVHSDFTVTLGDPHHHSENNDVFVEVEDNQKKREEEVEEEEDTAVPQMDNESVESKPQPTDAPSVANVSEKVTDNQTVLPSEAVDKETDNITGQTEPQLTTNSIPSSGKENNINHECIMDEDCEKGRYCLFDTHGSKCLRCKAIDVPCTKDEECCAGQLCVWGQCTQNATKGEAGNICQYQTDCNTDLCCAFHKALLFPVCSAKPIERERCYGSPNHLMALLSWDMQGEGPREHCPCAGNLECQPLGRGSMCLKEQNSSEEEMTDTLYSEIDYIV